MLFDFLHVLPARVRYYEGELVLRGEAFIAIRVFLDDLIQDAGYPASFFAPAFLKSSRSFRAGFRLTQEMVFIDQVVIPRQ